MQIKAKSLQWIKKALFKKFGPMFPLFYCSSPSSFSGTLNLCSLCLEHSAPSLLHHLLHLFAQMSSFCREPPWPPYYQKLKKKTKPQSFIWNTPITISLNIIFPLSVCNRHHILYKYLLLSSLVKCNLHRGRFSSVFSSFFFSSTCSSAWHTQYISSKYLLHDYSHYCSNITWNGAMGFISMC